MGCSYGLMVCHVGYNSSPYPGPGQNIYQKIKKIFINKLLYLEKNAINIFCPVIICGS